MTLSRVNLVLFETHELGAPLARTDRRARHLLEVLRRGVGEAFDAGVVNGPRGRATLTRVAGDSLAFSFVATTPPPPPEPVTLLVGLPRPQTARDVLRDATTLGVGALHFVRAEKAERSYAQSSLWSSGEWRRHVLAGAEQAFATRVPEVTHDLPLADVLATLPADAQRLALDNYESPRALADISLAPNRPAALALGAERGWSAAERALLRAQGFALVHLGARVLRTETAVVAALTLVRARLGLLGGGGG
jgi:RsmE family RNA methyltransferase